MKAWLCETLGGIGALQWQRPAHAPSPSPGEVLHGCARRQPELPRFC